MIVNLLIIGGVIWLAWTLFWFAMNIVAIVISAIGGLCIAGVQKVNNLFTK